MTVSRVNDARFENNKYETGFKLRTVNKTVGADITLVSGEPPVQVLTITGSARNITLPAISDANEGLCFIIVNIAASALNAVVKDAAANTIVTVAQNKTAMVVCDGVAWRAFAGA